MNFEETVLSYKTFLDANELAQLDNLRVETQVESLKDWSSQASVADVEAWYLEQQANCTMTIEDIPLADCRGWSLDQDTGFVKHESNDFFVVQGVRVGLSTNREVGGGGWDQPILTQVGFDGGLLGIIRQFKQGIPYYLVEAKAEPGNPDLVQISPTLQATFSNLKQAHGGKKPRFAEYFEEAQEKGFVIHFNQWMSEDGGRLHLKRNKGMLVEIPTDHEIEYPETFKWLSLYQIKTLIKKYSWVNPHIRGIISHL